MKLKLSHVMPYAWFYKLRDVGGKKTKSSDSSSRDSSFISPVNHKAIDIPFPAETPKRAPLIQPGEASDGLEVVDGEFQPSIVIPYAPAPVNFMSFRLEEDDSDGMSPLQDANEGALASGLNFDMQGLEKRLQILALDDRRRYQSSPMLLSVAMSSPKEFAAYSQGSKGFDLAALDSCHACDNTSNSGIADRLNLNLLDEYKKYRESPLLNLSYPNEDWPLSEGCSSAASGGQLCCSTDDSNAHSTSSSDIGFERESSSIWDRDVFSITSDGSEAFPMTYPEMADAVGKARLRSWRLREKTSPWFHGTAQMENGMYRFREPPKQLSEKDVMSSFCKSKHALTDERRNSINGHKESPTEEVLGHTIGQSMGITQVGNADRNKRGDHSKIEMPFLPRGFCHGEGGASSSCSNFEGSALRRTYTSPHHSKKLESISLPDNPNYGVSKQHDSGDGRLSAQSRHPACGFSYARCKERLLSGQMLAGAAEEQNLSNYARFKLRQRGLRRSKLNGSDACTHLDLDLGRSNTAAKKDVHSPSDDSIANVKADSISSPLRHDCGVRQCGLSHRQSTSSYRDAAPNCGEKELKNNLSNVQNEGPSGFSGNLESTREKMRDDSADQFSASTSMGGTCSTTSQSRVFDSFAMVKCSYDPSHDFKESMVEMVMEKGLQSSRDMVELLQCYLTLNADVYHDTIVNVFTEVWSEMFRQRI